MPILTGDAIQPGSLLQPNPRAGRHSITVLLPDGQRILYECFTRNECARGFRVPSLYRTPEPFAVEVMVRIRSTLAHRNSGIPKQFSTDGGVPLPRDEALAVLGPGNWIQTGGLAANLIQAAGPTADLPNGRYTYDLLPLDHAYPRQFHRILNKKGRFIRLKLPSSGLYVVKIIDDLNRPRIVLFIAAVEPAHAPKLNKSFAAAKALMRKWNDDYPGWPIHDFQWAYLESLVRHPKPVGTVDRMGAGGIVSNPGVQTLANTTHQAGVTAEPTFFPNPGVFSGDIAVKIRCATPGAVIRFTVDSSEPVASSPVYSAPVIVKGAELTIKAYATAKGEKDSPVVTGIFRIQHNHQ